MRSFELVCGVSVKAKSNRAVRAGRHRIRSPRRQPGLCGIGGARLVLHPHSIWSCPRDMPRVAWTNSGEK